MTRALDADFAEELAKGATHFCRCWRVRRRDGVDLGFTDHDRVVRFSGLDYQPETGFAGTELERSLGLGVDNAEAAGLLRSDAIAEEDVAAGLYDGAEVRHWLVDWRKPRVRHLVFVGEASEIRRSELGFEVEITGLSGKLDRPQGRGFQRLCDAELGDKRCGVDLAALRETGSVVATLDSRRFVAEGFELPDGGAGHYAMGRLVWTSGPNQGRTEAVRSVVVAGGALTVDLWRAPGAPASAGDAFEISAGCDKRFATCRDKFANILNFQGFPFLPGEDWATTYPAEGERHDGGSLFS
ncbi:MAG: DUF2163 domain-containing protein [Pseudomonadota bacterium]